MTRVFAIDEDSGENGLVTYTLEANDGTNETFQIDTTTGTITTISRLDREAREKYVLKVKGYAFFYLQI